MSSTAPRKVLVIPAASVATSVTSASPIISAAAVEAVRCGFRRALSRASFPAAPPIRAAGAAEDASPSGRTSRAEKSATPMKIRSAPTPIQSRIWVVPRSLPNSP